MSEDCPRSDYTPPVSLCPGLLLRLCICNNALDISPHYDHFIHFNEGQDNTIVPDIKKDGMGIFWRENASGRKENMCYVVYIHSTAM